MTDSTRMNRFLLIVLVLIFSPTAGWLWEAWQSDPYYSHGPLVLLVSLYLIWARRMPRTRAPSNGGIPLIAAALAVHVWAILWRAYYVSALMFPLALLGMIAALYGWRAARHFLFPVCFLLFMVPLPIAERVGPVLEGWTATGATALARALGIGAYNVGSEVHVADTAFVVGVPWGGLRSAVAIVTFAVLLAYVVRGSAWSRGLVLGAAVPIALAANTLRIALLFLIASAWGTSAGLDYFHFWSSPVLFVVAVALLLALARLVHCSNIRWQVVLPT